MNYNPITSDPIDRNSEYPASMQTIVVESHGQKLIGTVFIPQGIGPHPMLVLLHGFPGNEVNFDMAHAARRDGWLVVVFHYRGGWGSGGSYSFSNCVEDSDVVINFVITNAFSKKYRANKDRLVLAGHSLGGFVALKKVFESHSLNHAAFFAGFNFGYFADLIKSVSWAKDLTLKRLDDGAKLLSGISGDKLLAEMVNKRNDWDLIKLIPTAIRKDILVVGARFDMTAPIDVHHTPLVNALAGYKNILTKEAILETGHSFSDSRIKLTQLLIDWLRSISF